jgi:peptide/nickel transport system substrate-binding protein
MLRTSRRQRALPAIGALMLVAAACSSDDSSTATTVAATTPAPASAAPTTESTGPTDSTTGTTAAPTTAVPERGGVLRLGIPTDPVNLNPRGGGSGNDQLNVARQLFDSLVEQDPATGELIPWLAESWEVSADATTFTFHLRDDVTFSDGTPVTAEVVKQNFDEIPVIGAKANWAIPYFTDYAASTVVDEHTVTVAFAAPNAPFLQAAATTALAIVAPATLATPYDERATGNLVGSGPFVLESYTPNSEVVVTRRAGYAWAPTDRTNAGDAYLDRIEFKIIPEPSVRTGALQSGEIDAIFGTSPQDNQRLRDDGFVLAVRANPGLVFSLNPVESKPALADVSVRQAIAKAIDRTAIRDSALSPEWAVATSVLSSTTPGYVDESAQLGYDPDAARALLDAAGWVPGDDGVREKDGQRLHLVVVYVTNFAPSQPALELIQAELAEVGIEVELRGTTLPDLPELRKQDAIDLYWGNLSRADGDILRTQLSTAASNNYKISDPDLENLLQAQRSTSDPAARDAVLAEAQQRIVEQAHSIPVFELTTVIAATDSVHDLGFGADSRLDQLGDAWLSS